MSTQTQRYQVGEGLVQLAQFLDVDVGRVLRRAGLPQDFLDTDDPTVNAQEYYAVWDAVQAEKPDADLPYLMAEKVVEAGFDSSVYSFYSSPNVRVGLERKALLKPLLMPLDMRVVEYEHHVVVSFGSTVAERSLPELIGWFDLAYFVMAIRHATGVHVRPAAIETETARPGWTSVSEFFGCPVTLGSGYRIVLSHADASLPLITRNDALWEQLQKGLHDRFSKAMPPRSNAARVRQALVDGLPGGQVTADQIARALALSKRSLQRRLREEGVSFKDILEDTRRAMALNYLQNSEMSVQEIAYLLGFRDPSSFFRAFRGWTGQTPQTVRRATA